MDPSREAFNWFVRRWQVRLFIAGFVLPVLMFVLFVFVLRREEDASAFACGLTSGALLLTSLLLQLWRVERTARPRKSPQMAEPGTRREHA